MDITSPKPIRRKRRILHFAVLAAAASVLFAAYWFTRPPELVWWRSPEIGKTGFRTHMLIPGTWSIEPALCSSNLLNGDWIVQWGLIPRDRRPAFVQRLFDFQTENATLYILIMPPHSSMWHGAKTIRADRPSEHTVTHFVELPSGRMYVQLIYVRGNFPAFNRTYRQICNSLTIEQRIFQGNSKIDVTISVYARLCI